MKNFINFRVLLVALFGLMVLGVSEAYAGGSAYSRARAYLRSDAPSGSGKVYVGQAATSSPNYQTSSSSEKQGEKTTTTYHFYAQPATGYKFTGWYSKNANDEYVAAPNSTVSGTTYTYTNTHYVVNVTSGSNPSSGTSYTDKDLYAGFIKIVQLSFIRPEDGSFTIMHNGAAVADYASFTVDGKVVLTATPDAGYKLRGWYTTTDGGVTKNYFAFAEEIEPSLTSNVTIGAEFVLDDGKADFWVKGTTTTYNDLNAANTAAAAGSKVIVLVNSGTLPAGTYTISSGVTLLIPYGSDYSKINQPNIVHVTGIGSAPALSVYKKLSLAAGATINVSGNICVGGQMMSINGGNPTSVVRGRAGVLDLSRGGQINLNSGSTLYAWGFVQGQDIDQGNNTSGMGTVDAKSGSTVWEVFQCGEWRGGTASSSIYSNRSSWKFFPFQSYTVQNIEAPITYRSGATGKCKWTIFGDGQIYTVDFTLIGTSSALFNMSTGATLNKRYDATTDRICYELNGTNAVNALTLSAMGQSINSSDYRLPIPANMQITVTGGTTSISNQMVLHAGAYVDIRSGATLNINTNVYIFDQTDWDTYCMYKYYYRSYKSLTKHYDRGEGTSKATLEDATVIVDGNLTFGGSGRLYATTNGANIKGNNGGRITFGTLPTKTTIVMCKELKDAANVNVSSANMHNIDNSYTKAIASTSFYNVNGRWFAAADKDPKADHTYKFTYIKSGDKYGTGGTNATVNTLYRSGWIDVKADVCDNWWKGLNDTYLYNYTFNNAWHQYEQTPTVIGEGDEAATIYSGTDGKLYAKSACTWEEYSGADENCLQTIGGVKKAFVNGAFVALTKNTEDEAYHNTANATEYYICFKDICEWHAATKVAGTNKAYTVTATSQKYIWYNGAWLAATQESPYFYTRSESGEKTYYEYVGSAWTEANVVAESTRNGAMTRYFNLPDAFTDANDNTKPGESTTIKIMKNVTITSALTYRPVDAKGGTCTIDLNGFTLSGSIDNMITINHDKAVLVVLDQSPEETGKISISYSANNTRRRAVYVQNGRLMLNSGTIQATNSQAYVDAIYVAANELCDINGGQVKATATSGAYGVHTAGGTARCTIKGGTITASSPASKGVYSEGGEIRMSAGTVNATTTGTEAISLATTAATTSTINLTGGAVNATAANNAYGVQFGTSNHTGTATISGGTITANATTNTAYGIYSAGKTTVSGGKIYANATNYAYGAYGYSTNQLTINTTDTIHANATTRYAYGIRTYGQSGKLWVNGGVINVNAPNDAYGLYVERGTDTINGGEFLVRATGSSKYAYGLYLGTHTSVNCVVKGGKFKVTAASDAYARINTIASGGDITKLSLVGGYYSKEPQADAYLGSGSCIAAGKEVKDLDAVVEASLISAGYTKKIAGTEYTVTWCTMRGNTGSNILKTEKVESGKVPVWTGAAPNLSDANTTREWYGWTTETWNSGTKYGLADALPEITDHDVTYYARYQNIYAEVTANGTTTRYNSAQTAWTQALKNTQATIRLLSNLGTEASISNMTQLVFNPANANSIITLDLNGHSWTMGNHATASENKDIFLHVNPLQANCKLIITDNSASGNGYLMNKQAYSANLLCANVTAGELLLQGGGLKVNNTHATCNAVGVQANGGVFNMIGGLVESKKDDAAVTSGMASGVYAYSATNISGGTIRATNTKSSAVGVHVFRNTFTTTLSDDVHVITNGSQSYAVYGYGTVEVSGGTYDVTAEKVSPATWSTARGVYMCQSSSTYFGKATVKGNPVFNVTGVSGAAYGVYSYNHANVESVVEGGTFNVTTTGAGSSIGVTAHDQATTTVKGGTFNVSIPNAAYEQCFGAYAQTNGIVNVEGGTFTVSPTYVAGNNDCARISGGDDTQLNISGGTFTSTNCAYGVRCFNGTTRITGNPVFTARNGIDVATWANLSGNHTATVIVDGGTFIATTGSAIRSNKNERVVSEVAYNVYGDMTVWDGKFYSGSNQPIDASSGTSYLKIRGGYYSTYTSSNVSNLNKYVVSPSTTEAYATTIDGKAYTYRVNTKYNVTWSVNGVNTVQEYNRNEMPDYGSTPTISDGNTREFLGWNTAVDGSGDTIAQVTTDVTYYAVFRVWEAEVIEGESATGTKFEHFMDAFNLAKNMPVAKIKMLSNVSLSTQITLNPDSVAGSRPLTLDLNNHILEYTGSATSFLTVNKTGVKLIIDDQSVSKTGQIKHVKTSSSSVYNVMIEKGEVELTGGATIYTKNNKDDDSWHPAIGVYTAGTTNAVFTMTGGTIDTYSKKNAYSVYNYGVSNIRGGQVKATDDSRGEAGGIRALKNTVNISDNVVFTINSEHRAFAVTAEGQAIASSATQYNATVTIDGGTFNVYGKTTAEGLYVNASVSTTDSITFYSYEGDAIVNGGTFNVRGENGQIFGIHNYRAVILGKETPHSILKEVKAKVLMTGGTFNVESAKDGSGNYTGTGNIEGVRNYGNATITGGTIDVKSKQNTIGLRAWFGKLVIEGNPTINVTAENVTRGITVADYAAATWCGLNNKAEVVVSGGTFNVKSTANTNAIGIYACGCTVESTYAVSADVIVNGGEFIVNSTSGGTATYTNAVAVAGSQTKDNRLTINGGKFKMLKSDLTSAGYNTGGTTSTSQVVLNGGYYNREHSLITFKAPETQKTDITSAAIDPEYNNGYRYKLSTEYDITWNGGSSYTKTTKVMSGQIPTNTELVGKCFIRNDSAFYFTGWSPTPTYVIGETTYEAVGDYYEAEVKIGSGAWTRYTDFLEAWDVVQANANCSIRLLSNFTLADKILYKPTVANARTVFDLNNFTMTIGGTSTSGIDFNKADAVLTITDGSSAKGGKISMTRTTTSSTYTIYIYNGELKMAGGKIYVQNNQDKVNSSSWWPAIAVYVSTGTNAKLTMTGGTVESQAAYLAYTLYNYGTTNISGGTVRANATATGNSLGIYAVDGTATISGGTFNITASSTAVAATATGNINGTGTVCHNGTLNITGGTFNVSATNQSALALSTNGTGKIISGTVYKAHGVINVSGGTFNVSCPAATATQVFAVQCNGWRLFDGATPHAMVAEELSEMNISGGTFTVDTRNSGAWLNNGGNVDLLRCWGSLNVSGGTFTIYQYKTPSAIQVYRGKATVSGNPVFNVYSHTANARGITAAGWTHNDYCDKDAANNLAEAEINGGTFKIITEGQNTEGFLASGTTSDGGYAMNAKITVNGGTILTICPNESGHYPMMLSSAADKEGTYGTATSEVYVNGGRFKSRKGTEADNTSTGAVNAHNATGKIWLAGGYYETNAQLSARVADTCLVTTLTSAEMDPEYANGYRYRIDVDYQAKVTVGAVERKFALFRDAFDYAKTQNNATITLLRNINYEGLNFMYNPSSVRSCTLDLNGFTFKGAVSGHTGDASYNNDRLLVINKAGATFTIKDSSEGKTGKFSHEKSGATFSAIVYHGTLVLQSGTVHCNNTSGGSAYALRSENYTDALVFVTGGKAHAETTGTAYGLSTYNKATISGGEIIAESSAGEAYGIYTNAAEDTTVISGGRIYAAGTNAYGVLTKSVFTISGGKILSECTSADGNAFGVYVEQNATTINGADSIYSHAPRYAYPIYSYGSTAIATVNGGKIIAHNVNSANNGASIAAYALSRGTININNGTFYAQCDRAGSSNVQTTRTANLSTMNIAGGTFHAEGFQAVNARGGTTTISGGTFYGTTGICAMDWADAATITANVSVTGGTFDCTGVCLNVRSNNSNNSGKNGHSEVTISGGKFKTTGSTIAQLVQVDGTDPSTLTITGGYFNEKSGTTHRDQIAGFVTDTCKITDITSAVVDPEYNNGYRYRVDVDYKVQVTHGAVEKKFITLNQAFEYAKTQANPTITLIGNADFTGPYSLYPTIANWRGTLDLNNFTITSLQSASFADRYFALNRSDIKLTVTDNSGAKGGVWNMVGAGVGYTYTIGIVVGLGELELAGGKIYVENNNASQSVTGINTWCSTINKAFYTQTGGTLEAKSSKSATAATIYGATTISGGEVKATTTTGASATAFSLGSHDGIIGSLTVNGSPTITVNTATSSAYGIYSAISGGTVSISSGTFNITSGTTSAFGVYLQTNPSTVTISGGTFNITSSGDGCRGLYLESGNGTINVSGGTFNVTTATSGSASWYNIEGMRITRGTGTINCTGGTFNVTNKSLASSAMGVRNFGGTLNLSGTVEINATRCFYISDTYISEVTAYVNISGGTFNSVSSCIYTNKIEGTGANAGKYNSSNFTVTGGQFKTTGANHIDGVTPTSALHLQGGYFTERSGTNSRNNLVTYVSDPYEVIDLDTDDAEYIAGYRYTVANAPVAKVKVGSATTYYTTVLAALNYAKTVANPTITILKDAPLTARWLLNDATTIANWHGILDLNGKTITGTGTSYGIVDVTKSGIQLTIRDSSPGAAGKLTHEESQDSHWGININNGATLVLESGTIYVKNSKADVSGYTTGICVNSAGGTFTQTGGKVEVHAAKNVKGVYLYGGSATISGGEIEVATDLDPENLGGNAMAVTQEAASSLIINGTASLSATAASYAYGLYQNVASQTATIGGSATIEAHAATYARGVGQLNASTINIQGNADIQAESTTSNAYGVYQEKGATNVSASPSITVSAPTSAWAFCVKNSGTTLDVAGTGTFNATTTSTNGAYGINLASSAHVNVSGGTFNATSANESAYCIYSESSAEATVSGGAFTSRTAADKQSSFAAYASGGSMEITGGTFDASSANNKGNNLNVVRVNKGATMTISGGTFTGSPTTGNGVCVYGGTTTISGNPVFNTRNGVSAGSWCGNSGSETWTATVIINGGTFNTSGGYPILAEWYKNGSNILNSNVTVNGGHFKSVASSIVYKKANGDGTATLTINGGYFNEKASGTDYRTQVNNYKGSGKAVLDLDTDDAEYIAGYRYVVTDDPVAKVKVGSTVTYHSTVASAFTAANAATSASTITMLKDATATSYLHYTGSQNCTLDLNGHTISYDGTTTEHRLLRINNADITFTVTDNSVGKEGKLLFNTSKSSNSYGVVVIAGSFQLDAGTIEMHASGGTAYGVTPYNSGTSVTINGGKVYVVTTNSKPGYGAYSKTGSTTINGGTIQVEAAGAGYGIYYSAGTTTVTDGKFNISGSTAYATNLSSANANMIIQGGWYNTNTNLKPNTPYQVLSLAGQSPYLYEVAEAYTLTWTTDGDALTGTYTSGLTKPGTTITAPNTPTKTGYTFSAWTPAVAATMPAANTTYTATWTINSYDVTFNMQGHGSAIAKQTINYNGLVTEPATPTEANYVFGGWYKEAGCTNEWDFASDHVTAATTLYAKWTEAVASVTVSGATTYYTTLQEAFDYAADKTTPTIDVLDDISLDEKVTYTNTSKTTVTFDLQGHTISGGASQLITLTSGSSNGGEFVIKSSVAGGEIRNVLSNTSARYCVYLYKGKLKIESGTIYNENTNTGGSYAVYVSGSRTFTMTGGKLHAKASTSGYGVYSYGTSTISGGEIKVETSDNTASAVYAYNGTTTLKGTIECNIDGASKVYGAFVGGATPSSTNGTSYNGKLVIEGGTFNVTAGASGTAYGVYCTGNTRKIDYSTSSTYAGNYAAAGTAEISGGVFTVKGKTTYGVGTKAAVSIQTAKDADGNATYAAASATPRTTITGGKFDLQGTTTKAAVTTDATNENQVIEGGWYSEQTGLANYVAPTKSCNYRVLDLPASELPYKYEVTEAYQLTWNLNGGTVTTAGTGAAVDATGTPSIVWGVGDAITAPTIVRDGYTFAAWTPAVAATMPSANTTYTAQWAVASVTTNDVTTLYTDINAAWTAVRNATAETTLKLLQDISTSSTEAEMLYENAQNCTLDLNGHTLSMTNTASQSPLHINSSGITFTITDGTVDKSGKLSMTSSSTSTIFGAYAENGNLVLDAGTIEVKNSSSKTTCGVTALTTGTFTMNGGTIHVVTSNSQEGRGLYFNGTMTVNSGTIHVEAAGNGYGIYRDSSGGTATVNGGKFNITSSSGTAYITNQGNNTNVKIYGGYYNINSRLGTCVTAPKYVFRTTAADKASVGEDYEYKVTTGYVITYNKGANGTGTIASGTKAHGDDFTLSSSTFTRTGYTQTGWSTSDGGAKVYELGGTYSENADLTVYPFWTAQNYTVTLNSQAATTPGTASITVTYNSNANLTATPAITVPTKTGYTFGGYYTEQGGSGKQVIAANGNVNASVSGITDASKNWIASTGGTIYAKWTQTVTLYDNNGGIHNGSLEVTYNLAYKSGTPPTREGYTAEGYYAEPACTNKVLTTAAVWVNYSGWVEGGKWVHDGESTLYTKWIEDTHNVTVAAGANGSASPASVSGVGITTASGDITATPNTGYHFTNWTLVSGVTAASTYTASSNPIRINATADGKTITANFAANTNTAYTVKHYKQNLAGDGYDLADTDNLTGTTGASVTPAVKSYTGFTAPSTQTETIAADGSLVIEYQYTRNSYTLTWALDGGSITAAGTAAGSVKYGASLTAPTVTKAGYNFTGWSSSVPSTMPAANSTYTATWEQADLGAWLDIVDVDNTNLKLIVNVTSWAASGWPYTINGVAYEKTAREADRTLKIPYVGTPGDNYAIMVKKTGGDVISHHTYVIPQEITSNTTITANQTKNLYVKDGVNLTVNANITAHNIYVAPEATLTINSGKTLTADSIFLRTTADHAAEMVLSGNLAGTTQLVYTRIIKDKDFHLFGIPLSCDVEDVHLSDGFVPTYKTGWVLRYYNEKRRSNEGADDNNWATVKEDSTITGGSGYELFSGSNYYREFYFPVDHKELTNEVAVVYDLGAAGEKHAGWNAITSPFTSTYTNVKVPEGLAVSWYMGGYYSQEIPTTIPAATVFAFQATKTGTISFEGESIVAALPRRAATEEAVRIQWLDLDIADANGVGDQTSIYSHPTRYDAVFQKGIDIAKQSFEAPRAIIYSSHAYGEMAFAGVADSLLEQGVALTVYSPTAQPLTISMRDNDWLNRMKYVWLIDHQTGERTDLLWENYTYEASEGTTRGRFTIQGVFRTPTITTDIENGMMNDESMQVEKFILNDKIYIRVNGHLYDATGKLVNRK